MVLQGFPCGRVGRRRAIYPAGLMYISPAVFFLSLSASAWTAKLGVSAYQLWSAGLRRGFSVRLSGFPARPYGEPQGGAVQPPEEGSLAVDSVAAW